MRLRTRADIGEPERTAWHARVEWTMHLQRLRHGNTRRDSGSRTIPGQIHQAH